MLKPSAPQPFFPLPEDNRNVDGPMLNRLIAAFFLFYMGLSSALLFVVALAIRLVTASFDRRRVALHMFTSFWACLYIWTMPAWRLSLTGRERIDPRQTYIIVSNHQSQLDILAAFRLFFPFKWVSKAEVFRIPFIGWNMVLNGYIRLRRGDKQSVQRMMAACERALRSGSSVFFFPEGTRSATGELRPFKPGAFILAHRLRLPILPVVIHGTRKALPKYSLNFHGRHHIRIEVLDPVPFESFKDLSVEETGERLRQAIAAHLDD